jgi:hypothetical protein
MGLLVGVGLEVPRWIRIARGRPLMTDLWSGRSQGTLIGLIWNMAAWPITVWWVLWGQHDEPERRE